MRTRFFVYIYFLVSVIATPIINLQAATTGFDIPFAVRQAIVLVECGNRQGSGVVVNSQKGYILTNAHLVLDLEGSKNPDECSVGFISDTTYVPTVFYHAAWIKYIYDESTNRDFALLQLREPKRGATLNGFPFITTDEFSEITDSLSVVGYPGSAQGVQTVTSGTIQGLERGIIKTNAVFSPGASGGAGLDHENHLIGLATRILVREIKPGVEEIVHYELVDIRAILTWLDTFGSNAHDLYITHADPIRYHGPESYITPGKLNCLFLAKTPLSSTISCLQNDRTRFVFPDAQTFLSWFGDFSAVTVLSTEQFESYRPSTLVTMKPGSLIKIESDPKVYLITDTRGTLRLIPNEQRARKLFGAGWAGFVHDLPVTFFSSYHIGPSLPE